MQLFLLSDCLHFCEGDWEEGSGEEQGSVKEQGTKNYKTRNQKRKHCGPTIETGKKRSSRDSKFKEEPYTADGKGQKGKGQKGKRRQKK